MSPNRSGEDPWWKQGRDGFSGLGNPKPAVGAQGPANASRVIELDGSNFKTFVANSGVPFLVAVVALTAKTADAAGVSASQMMLPTVEELAARTVGALAVGVLPLEQMDLALRSKLSANAAIPISLIFEGGREAGRIVGAMTADQLLIQVAAILPALATPPTAPVAVSLAAPIAAGPGGQATLTGSTNDFSVVAPAQLPSFTEVGGLDDVKRQLNQSVGLILRFPAQALALHVSFNGVLLYGPPGSGKTYLARAMAGEYKCNFVSVGSSQLISPYAGESSRRVAAAFSFASAKAPSILFFDEFDSIGQRRDNNPNADRQVVEELLRNLESIRSRGNVIVVAATNAVDALDPAVTRPGRFDLKVRIDLPDADSRMAIFRAQFRGRPVDRAIDLKALAAATDGRSAAAIAAAVNRAALGVLKDVAAGAGSRVIGEADLLAALSSTGGRDRPLAADWQWEDLVLPAATKQKLQQLQELIRDPSRARDFGITPPSGALLYGPPGTGKTTIAKVLAAQANTSFYALKSSDLLSKWVGESEQNVAQVFTRARENAPSIVFIDEIESIAARRGGTNDSGIADRVLNQLLAEIDGLSTRPGVFVMGATNRADLIDEAILRGGRLETHIEIGLPDAAGRLALLQLFTKHMPIGTDMDLGTISRVTDAMSPADLRQVCQEAGMRAMHRGSAGSVAVSSQDFREALADMGRQMPTAVVPVKWW